MFWDSFHEAENIIQQLISDDLCLITFNEKYQIQIPLLRATFFSSSISQQLKNDITQRNFSFEIKSEYNKEEYFMKLINLFETGKNEFNQTIEELLFVGKVAFSIQSRWLKIFFDNSFDVATLTNNFCKEKIFNIALSAIEVGITFKDEDITYIAGFINELINSESPNLELFKDTQYIGIIELVLKNNKIKVISEDVFMNFVLSLCKLQKEYENLFQYIFLEYCSLSAVKEFMNYVESQMCFSLEMKSAIKCINRRLLLQVLQNPTNRNRYIEDKKNNWKEFIQLLNTPIECPFNKNDCFDGIIKFLTKLNNGWNIYDTGIIKCTAYKCLNSISYLLKYDSFNPFTLYNQIDNYFCFDFKNKKVALTGYSFEYRSRRNYQQSIPNFSVEGSNDDKIWEKIESKIMSFNGDQFYYKLCEPPKFYRNIKFIVNKPSDGRFIDISKFELFGFISTYLFNL